METAFPLPVPTLEEKPAVTTENSRHARPHAQGVRQFDHNGLEFDFALASRLEVLQALNDFVTDVALFRITLVHGSVPTAI